MQPLKETLGLKQTNNMVYRIAGGVFFILAGLVDLGVTAVPLAVLGVVAFIAGIALIAGV